MVNKRPSFASYRHTGGNKVLLLSAMQAAVTAGEWVVIDAASLHDREPVEMLIAHHSFQGRMAGILAESDSLQHNSHQLEP